MEHMITLIIVDLKTKNGQAYLHENEINIISMDLQTNKDTGVDEMNVIQQKDLSYYGYGLNDGSVIRHTWKNQQRHKRIDISEGVCVMEKTSISPTKDENYTNKLKCLQNLWNALKDRYMNGQAEMELNTNDSCLRKAEY